MNQKSLHQKNKQLLLAYSKSPSITIRNQLVQINAGLVRQIAHQIQKKCSEPYEDLEQIGYFGLIRAIERFNIHRGFAFSSFAMPYIRGEMLHYLRDKANIMKIPRKWQELYAKGKKAYKNLTVSLGRSPTENELIKALGVSELDWNECKLALQNRTMVSLDAKISQLTDSNTTFSEILADPNSDKLQKSLEENLEIFQAINLLEEKTKTAIECVYLLELPRKEAAKQMGISPMTVTRRLQKGIKELVKILEPQAA